MRISNAQFTVAEYVKQMQAGDIKVNKDYQRSSAVWPAAARSYLIDTIIQGYPVPKLSLYQKTDLRTRTTVKEIVDGQQRSQAIRDFFENALRISGPHSRFKGKTFDQLPPEDQERFLTYAVTVDVFAAATDPEIREVFRRINSFNVPLNPAEKRHATFQGDFKWFIVKLSESHAQSLKDLGIFGEAQLARMYDAALFSEVCRSIIYGIDHASESKLEALYREFDSELAVGAMLDGAIDASMSLLIRLREFHNSPLYKPYNAYSLMTAISHVTYGFEALQSTFRIAEPRPVDAIAVVDGLSTLLRALEEQDTRGPCASFVTACAAKTNRKEPRQTRFVWFCKALTGQRMM